MIYNRVVVGSSPTGPIMIHSDEQYVGRYIRQPKQFEGKIVGFVLDDVDGPLWVVKIISSKTIAHRKNDYIVVSTNMHTGSFFITEQEIEYDEYS